MAIKFPTLPGWNDPALTQTSSGPILEQNYFAFLKQLFAVVADRAAASRMVTGSGAPTTADIPDGEFRVWKNTGAGTVRLYVNDGGSLKSVALT